MFGKILDHMFALDPKPLPQRDARLALTALMVRIARTDGNYAASEIAVIDRVVCARYGLSPEEARQIRAQAEDLEAQAPDTVRFTRAIKDVVPHDDRVVVLEALWSVVLADGTRDDNENALMRMVAPLLGFTDMESNLARQKAERAA